jgi:predicted nucleotide-binding protein (sugar kinase/HSP70/actin superfamily)
MRLRGLDYTRTQVLEDIRAIEQLKDEQVKLPLAVLKREEPEAFKLAVLKSDKKLQNGKTKKQDNKTGEVKEKHKIYLKRYRQTDKFKNYIKARQKAIIILRKRHYAEYKQLLKEIKKEFVNPVVVGPMIEELDFEEKVMIS